MNEAVKLVFSSHMQVMTRQLCPKHSLGNKPKAKHGFLEFFFFWGVQFQ